MRAAAIWVLGVSLLAWPSVAQQSGGPVYETASTLAAADFVPDPLRRGPVHRVADEAVTRGFDPIFQVASPLGDFQAVGLTILRARVQELQAILALRQIGQLESFSRAIDAAANATVADAADLIRNPPTTVSGFPEGVFRLLAPARREGAGRSLRRTLDHDQLAADLAEKKRKLASDLGVDNYSSNKLLQRALNRVAWAQVAGGLSVRMGTSTVSPGPVETLLRDAGPTALSRHNGDLLRTAGLDDRRIEALLGHRWFTPSQQTYLVSALVGLQGVAARGAMIDLALQAQGEYDAWLYRRMAAMFRAYHERVMPLSALAAGKFLVHAVNRNGSVVVMLPVDYLQWRKRTALALARIRSAHGASAGPAELWLTGRLSARARAELERLGWRLREQAGTQLGIE